MGSVAAVQQYVYSSKFGCCAVGCIQGGVCLMYSSMYTVDRVAAVQLYIYFKECNYCTVGYIQCGVWLRYSGLGGYCTV